MSFAPIAIVGRACLLPGAHTPHELYELARTGRCELRDAPVGRWRVPDAHVLADSPDDALDRSWTRRGGYVEGFSFDAEGYRVAPDELRGLDPIVHWVVDTGRRALADADLLGEDAGRTGAVVGNLSLPSSGSARFAERVWLGPLAERVSLPPTDPRDRFNSGLPALLLARALGLGAGAYALDAACASSLYAIENACRALQEHRADRMLAGAVNHADDLFLHVGFCALGAMSKSGRSRPFHAGADGLVPGEGCGIVVLERLEDAVRAGRTIHGVIRGVGLANDGRGEGLLAPSEVGQARAMRIALAQAGIAPEEVPYVECHATGTPVGDATELASMAAVYGDHGARIGSLKANLGHLITAAGVAGLIKVLESLREGVILPTPHLDDPSRALADSPFEVLDRATPWSGPRRAGLSAFGFGGNDAHLLVEAYEPDRHHVPRAVTPRSPVVVVGLGARVGDGRSVRDLERTIFDGRPLARAESVRLEMASLRFPPNDLRKTNAHQTMLLGAALEATGSLALPCETTGVFVGYGCDPEIARWGARWRTRSWGEALGADGAWIERAADAFAMPLEAAHVVGSLPNIPANRLSSQLDLGGPSHTVSSEELSGIHALELAIGALRRGDIDAALVGAVDLSCEPVHRAARGVDEVADAAVVLVLWRRQDAETDGLPIIGEVDVGECDATSFVSGLPPAHAAVGLVEVVAALLHTARARRPEQTSWTDVERRLAVRVDAFGGGRACVEVVSRGAPVSPFVDAPDVPSLSLPAHPPAVVLPPLARPIALRTDMQIMRPAPALPPTSLDGPPSPPARAVRAPMAGTAVARGPAHVAPQSVVAAGVVAPTAAAPPPPPMPPCDDLHRASWLATHAEHLLRLADAHETFLAQQAAVHQQFLQTFIIPPLAPSRFSPSATPLMPMPLPLPLPLPLPESESVPVPVPVPVPAELPFEFRPRGPSFTRDELLVHAAGTISEIFGPLFEQQDRYAVQVRMPEPPLLLADRCTGIDAVPGSMKKGTCWTETDVRADSWYLHDGTMPTGIMVESGQADLFLISYLGADVANRGDRAYRLLGCEMKWVGDLPQIGESLVYEIHVDGHAAQGDVRLFFFHYDCHVRRPDGTTRPALEVRGGQAGFFTKGELADSAGILWTPEGQEIVDDARVDPPAVSVGARSFDGAEVRAFAAGRPWECFGEGFLRTKTHTRTPRIQGGRMLFLDTIERLDPAGGPWGRGYLKAVTPISPDDWYFEGHFKNDPCMPGTLMLEGCVQAMAFYLCAMGYSVRRDGWRFRPIANESYSLRCRGQVIPTSKELTYEIFVEEVHDGPVPRLYADLLCTVDGLGAFHARRFGLELVPSWPLTSRQECLAEGVGDPRAATASYEGGEPFRLDYPSLLACAWGQPSTAFGPMYERFDGVRRTPRLPGPPYHFLTRVTTVGGAMGGLASGTTFEMEYDIPSDAWYFDENGARVMPFAVLLEAALQPCGWVASFVGSTLTSDSDLLFRNLDGKGTIKAEVFPESGTLRTTVKNKSISRSSGMIIESFDVRCYIGDTEVYELDTVFGFFPPEAFENQAGLPISDEQRALFDAPANADLDLRARPPRFCRGTLRLAQPMLLMIDRVSHLDPRGGRAGKGALRAEKDVDAGEWFFKSHFYQDPVQPGSLGIEAMLQALQVFMIEADMGRGLAGPRFEAIATDLPHVWKYRGQVVPENSLIVTTLEVVETGTDARGVYALADASLWVDEKRIYEAHRLGMRIVAGAANEEERLDPSIDTWLDDHRPTYTTPALPMMSMVDRMMAAARADRGGVDGLRDLCVERWVVLDGPVRLRTEIVGDEVRLLVWRDASNPSLSRFEIAARATIGAPPPMEPLAPLGQTAAVSPYAHDRLFHGPAFHYARSLSVGAHGSSMVMDAASGAVPFGLLNQGLLDAATHGIEHDRLHLWSDRVPEDLVGYPHRLDVRFDGEAPRQGEVRCEARLVSFHDDDSRFPVFRVQLLVGERVFADMRLVEILMPKGPLGVAAPTERRRFLADRVAVPGVGLARRDGDATRLRAGDVALSNWFPGTIRSVYGTDVPRDVAIAEHVAHRRGVHPRSIAVRGDQAIDAHAPLTAYPVTVEGQEEIIVRDAGAPRLAIEPVAEFWREHFAIGPWPVEELYYGLLERFVAAFHVEDPDALAALRGRGVLYLGNHQVGIESLIFSIVASALQRTPTLTLAKVEHRESWLGELIAHCFTWPGVEDPGVIAYFDRRDPTSLPRIAKELATATGARSLMVHVEGTRAHSARHRVEKMSGIFCDLAIEAGVPIVPVRFRGGLPVDAVEEKLEYPVGMGRQDYWLGRPIAPAELAALSYKERIERVVTAIEGLGPSTAEEVPRAPDVAFEAKVTARVATGVPIGVATLVELLAARADAGPEVKRVLAAVDRGDCGGFSDDDKGRWLAGLARLLGPR